MATFPGRFAPLVALAFGLGGCGGDDPGESGSEDPAPACLVSVELSGGVDATLSADSPPACGIPFGSPTGVDMIYLPFDGTLSQFEVVVDDITEGATGTFSAAAVVRTKDERFWSTGAKACSVKVDEQTFESEDDFSKGYQMAGSGSCSTAAAPDGGMDPSTTIAPFSFRFPARWAH